MKRGIIRNVFRVMALVLCLALSMPTTTALAASSKKTTSKKTTSKKTTKKKSDKIKLDKYKKDESRYISLAYVATKSEKVIVRSEPSSKSKALYKIQYGDALVINPNRIQLGKKTVWIPVYLHHKKATNTKYGKWKTAYIHVTKVKLATIDKKKMTNPYNKYSAAALRYGLRFLGAYHENGGIVDGVQKGTNIRGGVACSYFVNKCYRAAGKSMPKSFMSEILAATKRISKSQLRSGDIIFYYDGSTLGHVALYMGNNFMLSASGHYGQHYPNGGVCIKRVDYGSRRISNAKFGRVRVK